ERQATCSQSQRLRWLARRSNQKGQSLLLRLLSRDARTQRSLAQQPVVKCLDRTGSDRRSLRADIAQHVQPYGERAAYQLNSPDRPRFIEHKTTQRSIPDPHTTGEWSIFWFGAFIFP